MMFFCVRCFIGGGGSGGGTVGGGSQPEEDSFPTGAIIGGAVAGSIALLTCCWGMNKFAQDADDVGRVEAWEKGVDANRKAAKEGSSSSGKGKGKGLQRQGTMAKAKGLTKSVTKSLVNTGVTSPGTVAVEGASKLKRSMTAALAAQKMKRRSRSPQKTAAEEYTHSIL